MDISVTLALIAVIASALTSVISPTILSILTSRQARAAKLLDWQRQDLVAEKAEAAATAAEKAAQLARDQASEAARKAAEVADLLLISDKRVAAIADITINKLDVIHTLVNSTLTASKQANLDSARRELVLLRRSFDPPSEDIAAISAAEDMIAALEQDLHDRASQTALAEAQILSQI